MSVKSLISYETVTVKIIIPPGWIVELPLKTCVNSPFLNISNNYYEFQPITKHHFIGLVEHLPDLVLDSLQTIRDSDDNELLDSEDKKFLFKDYKTLYKGIYNQLVSNEGFLTTDLHKFNNPYFRELSNIYREFFSLIEEVFKIFGKDLHIQKLTDSPVQNVWFNCLFSELKNTFFENGLLGLNVCTSKKIWANRAIKNINNGIDKVTDSTKPVFYDVGKPTDYCSKSWVLVLIKKLATQNDECYKRLKKYYQLEKQFLKKYRDHKDYQLGYINKSGTYVRGRMGRMPDNL